MSIGAASPTPIVVAVVHGVSIDDPHFADAPMKAIRAAFRAAFDGTAPPDHVGLLFAPVNWGDAYQVRQRELFDRLCGERSVEASALEDATKAIYAGDTRGLLSFGRALLERPVFDRSASPAQLNYLALRWLLVHFVGDAIAYPSGRQSASYLDVHRHLERALATAAASFPEAPLAVVAHSLGTVIASDFFYDRQAGKIGPFPTPLERGETLDALFTLGSPLALWMLRAGQAGLDRPIEVPAPRVTESGSSAGGWWNFFDPDDVIASPLQFLSEAYAAAVTEDIPVHVGPKAVGMTPVCHPLYWTDPAVTGRIGQQLAKLWVAHNPGVGVRLRAV